MGFIISSYPYLPYRLSSDPVLKPAEISTTLSNTCLVMRYLRDDPLLTLDFLPRESKWYLQRLMKRAAKPQEIKILPALFLTLHCNSVPIRPTQQQRLCCIYLHPLILQ